MDERHRAQMPDNTSKIEIGELVLVEQGSGFRRGPESKLLPLLAGPFEVNGADKDIYTLRNVITNKLREVHIANLHRYVEDESLGPPTNSWDSIGLPRIPYES